MTNSGDPRGQGWAEELPPFLRYFHELQQKLGAQGWWPARMAFKVIAGAILVQNTAWVNLEPAMVNLRQLGLLTNNCSGHPLNILLREGL